MTTPLAQRHCEPCHGGTPRIQGAELQRFMDRLGPPWELRDGHHLEGDFSFSDFMGALRFTNRLGALAEAEGHHPEVTVTWGRATVRIWTHAIDGLSENDFILAAKAGGLGEGSRG